MTEISPERPLRVCYFGTYRANYSRNQILIGGLRAAGAEVYECHATLWHGIEDRVQQASGGWRKPRFWFRVLMAYVKLFWNHRKTPPYDVMLIGYPGQFDAFLGRWLSWWRRRPMALDILMSLHLVAEERGLTRRNQFTGRLIFWLEWAGLRLPDLLIAENGAYEVYLREKYKLPAERFMRVPHGADDRIFHPRKASPPQDCFLVTYHGMFLPSHGLATVIGAAEHLRDRHEIWFNFYGIGPERARVEEMAKEKKLANVRFHDFVSRADLLDALARSHICLGVFGTTLQSNFTVQNKVWEGVAMGRPVISGDSPTVREALNHGEHIYLIERENGAALATAIVELQENPALRQQIAQNGYRRFVNENSVAAIGMKLENTLRRSAGMTRPAGVLPPAVNS